MGILIIITTTTVRKEAKICNQYLKRSWLIETAVVQWIPLINNWKIVNFQVGLGMNSVECWVGLGLDWSKFGFGWVRSYQVFRHRYLPRLYLMVPAIVILLQFLKLLMALVTMGPDVKIRNCQVGLWTDKKSVWSDRDRIDRNPGLVGLGHLRFFGPTTCPTCIRWFSS